MNRNSVLLSISAALLFSLYCVDGGVAFQIGMNQNAGTAILPTKHVSTTPTPCAGRTAVTCQTQSPQGSGAMATAGSRYTSHVSTTPNSCGGRTGAACTTHRPQGSGAMATGGSQHTNTTSEAAMLLGAGLIALVLLGARRLRHPHGHHA
jgi:hypothetical protein